MLPPRPLVLLLALATVAAGCIGKEDVAPSDDVPAGNQTTAPNATLPDGRGESAGLLETNKTEEGVGGVEHRHDYWEGKEQVVLFDRTIFIGCPPCMPDGEGTDPKAVQYVKLGKLPEDETKDALVYEGASKVEVLFGEPRLLGGMLGELVSAHPAPPSFFLQYRSASDSEWTQPVQVTPGTPMVIQLTPHMADMPHSTHSLWVFRVTTDRPDPQVLVPMKVTVFKGADVVDWPGHPDFYADKSSRIVMQQHVTTHMSGIEGFFLYDTGGTWAHPEKLISWGTKEIRVIINITSASNAYGAAPTGYFLEAHNATIIGPEVNFGSRHADVRGLNDLKNYEFALLVDEAGMDGPYQPASRWGFRAMATFADFDSPTPLPPPIPNSIGLCPGCFPYDIEYDITVIAMNYLTGEGEEMDEL
ncbi:MAG TPA: hypothetical protein VFH78_06180 [Candidatus Thermoplasmatota archaeon]|nr:hypothetical protein [Candidatus Thermoplasmatota archaeon]